MKSIEMNWEPLDERTKNKVDNSQELSNHKLIKERIDQLDDLLVALQDTEKKIDSIAKHERKVGYISEFKPDIYENARRLNKIIDSTYLYLKYFCQIDKYLTEKEEEESND